MTTVPSDALIATSSEESSRGWGDFGGTCLLGDFAVGAELLMPDAEVFGLPKFGSFALGTWRDDDGLMHRMIRGVLANNTAFGFGFTSEPGTQLQRLDAPLYGGEVTTARDGDRVVFAAPATDDAHGSFRFEHEAEGFTWFDPDVIDVAGRLLGPGLQWYHPWREGGGCYTATMKYASEGTVLGRRVSGFVAHEIHYFPEGFSWVNSRYGEGMEICWQQVANEYDDGTFVHATFAFGTDGWGFAMLHDEQGRFHSSTHVEIDAEVRDNGYPERITYSFPGQRWTWRIDPQGERPSIGGAGPIGADGTCQREGDTRRIVRSLGNSDWWTDGRYEASRSAPSTRRG